MKKIKKECIIEELKVGEMIVGEPVDVILTIKIPYLSYNDMVGLHNFIKFNKIYTMELEEDGLRYKKQEKIEKLSLDADDRLTTMIFGIQDKINEIIGHINK